MADEKETKPQEEPTDPQDAKLSDLAEKPKEKKDDFENDDKMVSIKEEEEPKKEIEVEKPEGLPNELWDKKQGTLIVDKTLEELNKQTKMASDFRKKISKGLKADMPEKPEGYIFEPVKDISDLKIGEDEHGKKTLETAKQAAFKSGIGQSQFNDFVNNYFKNLLDTGIIKKPLSEAEAKLENQKFMAEQKAKLGDNAEKIITGNVQWIEQNYKHGIFNEADKKILVDFLDKSAENILIIDKLRKLTGEPEMPIINTKIEGLPSDEEIMRKRSAGEYSEEEFDKVMAARLKAGRGKYIVEK